MRVVIIVLVLLAAGALSYAPIRSLWSTIGTQTVPTDAAASHLHSPIAPGQTEASPGHVHPPVPPTATGAVGPTRSSVAPSPTVTGAIGRVQPPVPPDPKPTAANDHLQSAVPTAAPSSLVADFCQALHDSFRALGPDGRWYPTWHPPTVGTCHFGHEHGDDPRGSPALNGRPVLFGYAAAQIGMSEPHAGFKVFRQDNINDPHASNHNGASVVMVLHQGSSGARRFTEVHHSVAFHYVNPGDGREVHVELVAPFGTLVVGCGANDPTMVLRQQQADIPGLRQVSADKCFDQPQIPYEDWITALYVGVDAQGGWKAYFDPHFAIFSPNTYCIVTTGACTVGYSDVRARSGADPLSTQAQFKGAKREAYLNQVWLDNNAGSTSIWTDAHGMSVSRGTPGAIEQYIASVRSSPLGDSIAFGEGRVYDDGTVHAPN